MHLEYNGNGENIINIPAHDLSEQQLDAIAEREQCTRKQLIKQLTKRGLFTLIEDAAPIPIDEPIQEESE